MIFEIEDRGNDYLYILYKSEVIPDLSVSIKVIFSLDTIEKNVDYGYGEYETHSSIDVEEYFADDYEINQIFENDLDADVSKYEKELLSNEAEKIFKTKIYRRSYNDLIDLIQKNKFASGGLVKLTDYFSNTDRFINYNGQFLYPPRIEHKLQPVSLDKFDNGDYVAQPKLNGSNTSVTISENSVIAKERHNKFFAIPPKFDFNSLHKGKGFMCITGEFMNKSKKDQTGKPFRGFCIWDIVAYDNKILIGSTIEERIKLLDRLYPSQQPIKSNDGTTYLFKTNVPDIYKVNNFYSNFGKLYKELSKVDMVEGFVLKRKSGKLEMMTREQNNTGWAVKVRKPTSNYTF